MSDAADLATEVLERAMERRRTVASAPIGAIVGVCDTCERTMPRLIDGECLRCREGMS